jgi:long-subunit fatty acid transport protein
MNARFLLLIGLWSAGAGITTAQSELKGTTSYSYLGIGFPVDVRSSQASGMGVTGVSLANRFSSSYANPAMHSQAFFTTIGGGVLYRRHGAEDNLGKSTNAQLDFSHFQFVFPVLRERLGASFGVYPITETSYQMTSLTEVLPALNHSSDTLRYQTDLTGRGGLNRMEVGLGYRINRWLSVGYAPSLVFGTVRNEIDITFESGGYQGENQQNVLTNVGFGNRFGVFATVDKVFAPRDVLALGATLSLPVRLNTDKSFREVRNFLDPATNVNVRRLFTEELGRGDNELPLEVAAGITYYPNLQWLVSGDVLVQNWSSYVNFVGDTESYLRNRVKAGLGGQYTAEFRSDGGLFNGAAYRAGLSYDTGHLAMGPGNGTAISTILFTGGIGIPSRAGGSSIDLSFDYGIRGTTSHDLVREQIFAFRVSFNLSELMFLQRKLD